MKRWVRITRIGFFCLMLGIIVTTCVAYIGGKVKEEEENMVQPEECEVPAVGKINNRHAFEKDLLEAIRAVVANHARTVDVTAVKISTIERLGERSQQGCLLEITDGFETTTYKFVVNIKK